MRMIRVAIRHGRHLHRLVVQFATENPTWGYTRLRGPLANLGHELGRNTIKRILAEHGLGPAPKRGKTIPWKTFLKAHFGVIAATDFVAVEVLTFTGLVRYVVLFVIDLESRRVHLRLAISEFVEHYHLERNHQGLDNRLITSLEAPANDAPIARRERFGGLLSY